jgi:acylphosphatase
VANTLALSGSCRQLPDGSCEAIVQGNRSLVKQFVVACKRGPSEASVDHIVTELLPIDPRIGGFHVER